jgi:hypothetical protein
MAIRILTAATVVVALAAPAFADTTITSTRNCYSHHSRSSASGNWRDCTTDVKIKDDRPQPPRPNCAYLPNFGPDPRCSR